MAGNENTAFDPTAFLANAGQGRILLRLREKESFFRQGERADHIFYLLTGRAKLTVVSKAGKGATVSLFMAGDFLGEESIAMAFGVHMASVTAMSACTALKIERKTMLRVMHEEHSLAHLFLSFLLARSMRIQADLVDQRFHSCVQRLARVLLRMAETGKPGEEKSVIPHVTQETLAEMIGTTRSRVSFFMNRFRELGLIEYNGRIRVHRALLNIVLDDLADTDRLATIRVPLRSAGQAHASEAGLPPML